MSELIDKDEILKKAVTIPGPSGKSVFSVVFTDDILNAKPIEPTTKNDLGVDCIVDVLGSYTDLDIPYKHEIAENILTKLSSVTSQEPRKGHWIDTNDNAFVHFRVYKCSHCGATFCDYPKNIKKHKYCFDCGTKMVEPQESEG